MTETIQRYAAALYGLADGDAAGLLQTVGTLLDRQDLWGALQSAAVSKAEKEELLQAAPELAGPLRAFLELLLREDRMGDLPAILSEARRLDLTARGGAPCTVTCAREPDEQTRRDLERAVCRIRGLKDVAMSFR